MALASAGSHSFAGPGTTRSPVYRECTVCTGSVQYTLYTLCTAHTASPALLQYLLSFHRRSSRVTSDINPAIIPQLDKVIQIILYFCGLQVANLSIIQVSTSQLFKFTSTWTELKLVPLSAVRRGSTLCSDWCVNN